MNNEMPDRPIDPPEPDDISQQPERDEDEAYEESRQQEIDDNAWQSDLNYRQILRQIADNLRDENLRGSADLLDLAADYIGDLESKIYAKKITDEIVATIPSIFGGVK